MTRKRWNKYETALLIEYYVQVTENTISKKEAIAELSVKLREMAIREGETIDDMFRNENGVTMQFECMRNAFTEGEKGLRNSSKLFHDIAKLYKNEPEKFASLLEQAHQLCLCLLFWEKLIS